MTSVQLTPVQLCPSDNHTSSPSSNNSRPPLFSFSNLFKRQNVDTKLKLVVYPSDKEDYSTQDDENLLVYCLATKYTPAFYILVQAHEHILDVYADYIQKNHATCFQGTAEEYAKFFWSLQIENKTLRDEEAEAQERREYYEAVEARKAKK